MSHRDPPPGANQYTAKVAKAMKPQLLASVLYTWRCELPEYWPRGQVADHAHWRVRLNEVKRCATYVDGFGHPLMLFKSPVKLTITRVWGYRQRALDPDNLVASAKPIIDVLRAPQGRQIKNRLGVIVDDRPDDFVGGAPIILQRKASVKWEKLRKSQRHTGHGSKAIIEIEGVLR